MVLPVYAFQIAATFTTPVLSNGSNIFEETMLNGNVEIAARFNVL